MNTEKSNLRWCSNCWAMSTRPRITFNKDGLCNACDWFESKKNINWNSREEELVKLLDKHRSNDGKFDCLVPCSGGKDGSYVAYNLKHKYGMNPLCVTITPPLPTALGEENLRSFIKSGYDHISINPNYESMRTLNKFGFVEMGFPYYGWLISIITAPIKIAISNNIKLVIYGEDGEVEYGGSTETAKNPIYDTKYQRKVYLEGGYEKVLNVSGLNNNQLYYFTFPKDEKGIESGIEFTHWSYFENWDPYRNYLVAKKYCGLKEAESSNAGTFTNFAQNDQALYPLHAYLMYLKFGFGRANQDASIEIRRGAMTRNQAINLVNLYDGQLPLELIPLYLDYYQITQDEFVSILDRYVNKDLFHKMENKWIPKFSIK